MGLCASPRAEQKTYLCLRKLSGRLPPCPDFGSNANPLLPPSPGASPPPMKHSITLCPPDHTLSSHSM